MILGLDLATVTGYAFEAPGGGWQVGQWSFKPKGKAEPEGVRFRKLYDALSCLLAGPFSPITGVVMERTYSKSLRATEVLAGLTAVAELVCEEHGIEYGFCPAPTLKAFGRRTMDIPFGGDDKEAMRLYASARVGRELTDNEADAYWLVLWQGAQNDDAKRNGG